MLPADFDADERHSEDAFPVVGCGENAACAREQGKSQCRFGQRCGLYFLRANAVLEQGLCVLHPEPNRDEVPGHEPVRLPPIVVRAAASSVPGEWHPVACVAGHCRFLEFPPKCHPPFGCIAIRISFETEDKDLWKNRMDSSFFSIFIPFLIQN